ncbi:MAG TPA: hypothetical protein VMV26_10860 [Alphaproteobacteria bacterium]|jgi:hypothetical protein|nr:hypothetical protein [Alphaproteobacteria bacterium]
MNFQPIGKGRRMPSVFCLRGDRLEYIRAGSAFRRVRPDRMTETAEISSVYADSAGIPHVRFDVVFENPNRAAVREGPRILAVKTFIEMFSERVAR